MVIPASAKTLSPDDFLAAAAAGVVLPGELVVVQGDLDLRRHPLKGKVEKLTAAVIRGSLFADGGCALEECDCVIDGEIILDHSRIKNFGKAGADFFKLSARHCESLRSVEGFFPGGVDLEGSGVEELTDNFGCMGELRVERCKSLRRLDCRAGNIRADHSSLAELGPNLRTDKLSAAFCPNLEKVGAVRGLKWAGFSSSGLREISGDFHCGGTVKLLDCASLESVSGTMKTVHVSGAPRLTRVEDLVAGEVRFDNCPSLPSVFRGVDAYAITFHECGLEELPAGLPATANATVDSCPSFKVVPSRWGGDLNLLQLPALREIPASFRCAGKLNIEDCNNLAQVGGEVGGNLSVAGCRSLKVLPHTLRVDGNLEIFSTASIETLDCRVGGNVSADHCDIRRSGGNFLAGGSVSFRDCKKLETLAGQVEGDTLVEDSSLISLGADFRCAGRILLRRARSLRGLNCTADGGVHVSDSTLESVGPAFRTGGNLRVEECPGLLSLAGSVGRKVVVDDALKHRLKQGGGWKVIEGEAAKTGNGLGRGRGATRASPSTRRVERGAVRASR